MRQLLAIRAHGSVAKAARALGMSQPSLSSAVARLEDQLRIKLIHRSTTGSVLTPLGELIVDRAQKVVQEAEQLVRDAELIAGGDAGALRMGVGSSLKHRFLPRLLGRFTSTRPALRLAVHMADRDTLLPLLWARELDIVFCALGDEIAREGFVATKIFSTCGVAVAHPDHPLAGAGRISLDRFGEFPSAGPSTLLFTNAEVLDRPRTHVDQYVANDYDVLIPLALSGAATLIAPLFVVQSELLAGTLARLDLDWRFPVSFCAITSRAAVFSPLIAQLVATAAELGLQIEAEQPLE